MSAVKPVLAAAATVASAIALAALAAPAADAPAMRASSPGASAAVRTVAPAVDRPLPARLSETGLMARGSRQANAGFIAFTPQYPLWTDGLDKRRWLALPARGYIDAADPDDWQFPVGTRLFKEFAEPGGRPLETRMSERLADGSWRFAAYVWNAEATDAELAPEDGARVAAQGLPRGQHHVPSRHDCLACHDAGAGPVLGVSALQLSDARDPRAVTGKTHGAEGSAGSESGRGITLTELVARQLVRNLPAPLLASPPQIAAATPVERAALGYLHGNCGHCHNDAGPLASLDLSLAQRPGAAAASAQRTLDSLLGRSSRFRTEGASARIAPGEQHASVIAVRMQSDNPYARMPPLGVQVVDREGLALIERWIGDIQHRSSGPAAAPPAAPSASPSAAPSTQPQGAIE
jgi:hypothetical protein